MELLGRQNMSKAESYTSVWDAIADTPAHSRHSPRASTVTSTP